MNTLQLGYRGREYPVEKPDGVFRILVLGDSMVFGDGVLPEETITAHMERVVNQKYTQTFYHVINMSNDGFSVMDYESEFKYKGLLFKPDIVVLILCGNDAEVIGVQEVERYNDHCTRIWNKSSESWPFFYDSLMKLISAFGKIPCLVTYYGLSYDSIADMACSRLSEIFKKRGIPFLDLKKKLEWVPVHRQAASLVDGHPSGHVHRIAAIEICKKLLQLGYLPKKEADGSQNNVLPELDINGVSAEWKIEELRAWCSYRQDQSNNHFVRNFIVNEWGERVSKAYIARQVRIMDLWWQEIQNRPFFDWRWYRHDLIQLKNGYKILIVNISNNSEFYLDDDAFFRDIITFNDKKYKILEGWYERINTLNWAKIDSREQWGRNVQWVLSELIELKNVLSSLSNQNYESLSKALFQLKNRWNAVANNLYNGIKLLNINKFMAGFDKIPDKIDESPAIEIRVSLITKKRDILVIKVIGKGTSQFSITEGSQTFEKNTSQYILFKFPLMDLFSCELTIKNRGQFTAFEYRVNRSSWHPVDLSELNYESYNYLKTPFLPAFH